MGDAHTALRAAIEAGYESRAQLTPKSTSLELRRAVEETIELLDSGALRVAQRDAHGWRVNEWLKKAVLLSFRINDNVGVAGISTTRCR